MAATSATAAPPATSGGGTRSTNRTATRATPAATCGGVSAGSHTKAVAAHHSTRNGTPAAWASTSAPGSAAAASAADTSPSVWATAAAGAATRLAGSAASGTAPAIASTMGAVAICAPAVAATISVRRRRSAAHRAATSTPPVARTDSANPTWRASSGSIDSSTKTVTASVCTLSRMRPRSTPTSATLAMTAARMTEGCPRVSSTNHHSASRAARHRPRRPRPQAVDTITRPASSTATCRPDTTTRCDRPAAASSSAGRSSLAPSTRPPSSAARSGGRTAAKVASARRRMTVVAAIGDGAAPARTSPTGSAVATTPRLRRCIPKAPSGGGDIRATVDTVWPTASPNRSVRSRTRAATRRPSAVDTRTSSHVPYGVARGSVTTRPLIGNVAPAPPAAATGDVRARTSRPPASPVPSRTTARPTSVSALVRRPRVTARSATASSASAAGAHNGDAGHRHATHNAPARSRAMAVCTRAQTPTRSSRPARIFSPMPGTCCSSSTLRKPPLASR